MEYIIKDAYEYSEEIKDLFTEYTDTLIENDSTFKEYLEQQHYDNELMDLTQKYGRPAGRLYIAFADEKACGCIGLRKVDDERCELKRLYVLPEMRGSGLGKKLVELIIEEAAGIGYKEIILDTLPFLKEAIEMYKKYGFYEIDRYNDSPMDTSIYMCKAL